MLDQPVLSLLYFEFSLDLLKRKTHPGPVPCYPSHSLLFSPAIVPKDPVTGKAILGARSIRYARSFQASEFLFA